MSGESKVIDYKLDTFTRSIRFIAGFCPRTVTRVSLGVALALEDTATDPAGELLGLKLNQATKALVTTVGSVSSSVRNSVQSKADDLNLKDKALSKVSALGNAREFVVQAATEAKGRWVTAGYVPCQVQQPQEVATSVPVLTSEGTSTEPSLDPVTDSDISKPPMV